MFWPIPTQGRWEGGGGKGEGGGGKEGGERAEQAARSQSAKALTICSFDGFKQYDVSAKCIEVS